MSMTLDVGDDTDDQDERDDIDLDDDDDEGDDTDADDDADDLTPEELRAELKKVRRKLATTGKQTERQRTARRAAEKRLRELESASNDDEDDSDDDEPDEKAPTAKSIQKTVSRAVRERERQLQEEHRRDLINTRAETALTRAGVSEKNLRLLLREIDMEEIDFDPKTRSIDGLVEEVDRLKDEFPSLFRRTREGRRRVNGGDEREDRSAKRKRPMTATEIQAAQLRGH